MKNLNKFTSILVQLFFIYLASVRRVMAEDGTPIEIGKLDHLIWSIISTIQKYSLPLIALILAFLGAKLLLSGDDSSEKAYLKSWGVKIIVGGFIIFGASSIARALHTFLQ